MGRPYGVTNASRRASRAPAAPFMRRLVVMAKHPIAGRVKTRLAREVGSVRATFFARHALAALLDRLRVAGGWDLILAVSPDSSRGSCLWPSSIRRIGQGDGDLGARMRRILLRQRPGPVVIIGSDIPAVTPRQVGRAFRALGAHDVVLGPAQDGGYWLIGTRPLFRSGTVFQNVRWSSPHALADTCASLPQARVAMVSVLADVDTADDLSAVPWYGRRVLPGTSGRGAHIVLAK